MPVFLVQKKWKLPLIMEPFCEINLKHTMVPVFYLYAKLTTMPHEETLF